jgi:uroporphyrinogen decarboxylase
VLRALHRQEVDRVPCFFAAEDEVWDGVMAHFGLADRWEVLRHFDADTVQVSQYIAAPDLAAVETVEQLERAAWPRPEEIDVEGYARRAEEARASGLAVLGGAWATLFTAARRSMGEARYLTAMLDQPDLIGRLVEQAADCYLAINQKLFDQCAASLDIFFFGSDFGTQSSLFISRDLVRRFFLPHMKRLVEQAKGYGLKVMHHSCGAVFDLIPDFIECGIDMLDPVQVAAHGMSPSALAQRFGGEIAFHGGISTQTLLPHATPEQVRVEVQDTLRAFQGCGYVLGPDQWLMADVPYENMEAIYHGLRQDRG